MYKVVYFYDFVERKRVYKGFEVNKIVKEEFIGEYETLEEAKLNARDAEIEKQFPKGAYKITPIK